MVSFQFVYQAWITDPKTALRQRRKEKKKMAREEQKGRRKGSGEGECPAGSSHWLCTTSRGHGIPRLPLGGVFPCNRVDDFEGIVLAKHGGILS